MASCFNKRSRKSSIEGPYVCAAGLDILKIDKKSTNLYFIFQFGGLGALFGGITTPKPPIATRLGPEPLNDEGTVEIVHEICD